MSAFTPPQQYIENRHPFHKKSENVEEVSRNSSKISQNSDYNTSQRQTLRNLKKTILKNEDYPKDKLFLLKSPQNYSILCIRK